MVAEFSETIYRCQICQSSCIPFHDPTWDHNPQFRKLESGPEPGTQRALHTHVLSEYVNSVSLTFYLLWPVLAFKALKTLPAGSQSVLSNLWIFLSSGLLLALVTPQLSFPPKLEKGLKRERDGLAWNGHASLQEEK